jgi:branched-chain amino acid transport system ATP-binding protein
MSNQQPSNNIILDIRGVDSFYGELQVLRKATLKLHEGEVVALFGPNGHGKSTLLKAIAGIHPPVSGSIKYRSEEIVQMPSEKIVEMGLAYIPEARNLFTDMTVLENLRLGAYNRKARGKVEDNLKYVFKLFPRLDERKHQIVSTLSGGENRMVAVGRGLMSGASLLLIDEPSIGLSPIMKKAVFGALEKIKHETHITVLIVEQEVDNPLKLADRVYLLKRGQIFMEKPAGEVTKSEIEKAYF